MAGDWIKMRTDLADDPAVVSIAAELGKCEDTIVGKLHRLWSWADRHTIDGKAAGITSIWIDRYVTCKGFSKSMESAGWLTIGDGYVEIPNFERHNGESSKRRGEAQLRQRLSRARRGIGHGPDVTAVTGSRDEMRDQIRDQRSESDPDLIRSEISTRIRATPELLDRATGLVGELFSRCGTETVDGELLWKIALLVQAGAISHGYAIDAAEGARVCNATNRVAYFRTILRNKLKDDARSLSEILRRVSLPKDRSYGPPQPAESMAGSLADSLGLEDGSNDDDPEL